MRLSVAVLACCLSIQVAVDSSLSSFGMQPADDGRIQDFALGRGADSAAPSDRPSEPGSLRQTPVSPESVGTSTEPLLVPRSSSAHGASAADWVREVLTSADGTAVAGRPLSLLEALSSARGSQQRQLDVTHAYWRLAAAVAEYGFCFRQSAQLDGVGARLEDDPLLRTARASALAAQRMAELAVLAAQYDLAEVAMLPTTEPLPLPVDPPHVGTYRTYFDEVFSTRTPPARASLLHRQLPIRLRMIDARFSAVRAAEYALEAATEAYGNQQTDLAHLLFSMRQLGVQNRALMAAACRYNHDIADYALSVAGPQADERVLVAMLIRSGRQATAHTDGASVAENLVPPASEVEQATWQSSSAASGAREPTLAPPRGQVPSSVRTPTPAPPREPAQPQSVERPSSAAPSDQAGRSILEGPTDAGPGEAAQPDASAVVEQPMVPVPAERSMLTPQTVNRPTVDDPSGLQAAAGLYPALVDAKPAVRTKHLAMALHWNRAEPEASGESVDLRQCLFGLSVGQRRPVIGAYWLAAQRSAECEALANQVNLLEELVPIAVEHRHEPLGAEAMLHLQAGKLAAQADLLAAELDLLESRFRLTRLAGRPLNSPWLLPATAPHAGPYLLKLDAQPRELAGSWRVRRLAALIPALARGLEDRGAAVVEADAARATATAAYHDGGRPIDHVLTSIKLQTEETLDFLQTLTRYNEAIADYALAVLPQATTAEQLAKTLVVVRAMPEAQRPADGIELGPNG